MGGFARRFAAHRGALAGVAILALVVLMAATCSLLFEESPWAMVAEPPLDLWT